MEGITGTVATAAVMFAGTNIDDFIVLTVLFLASRAGGGPKAWQIWAGQYAGLAVLVAVSVLAALGLTIVPDHWDGLLGLIPFVLGIRGLFLVIRARNRGQRSPPAIGTGLLSVAGVTIANGGDNIAVYTPVFRTIGPSATITTIAVFAVGVALWCLVGSWLGSHKKVVDVVERYGEWIVPVVFMLIGSLVIVSSGILGRIF